MLIHRAQPIPTYTTHTVTCPLSRACRPRARYPLPAIHSTSTCTSFTMVPGPVQYSSPGVSSVFETRVHSRASTYHRGDPGPANRYTLRLVTRIHCRPLRDARILPGRRCEPSWCSRELRLQSLGLLHVLSSDPLQSRLTHRSVDHRHLTVPSSLVRPYFCCARPFRARDGQTIPSSGAHSVGIGQMKLRHLRSPIAWP